MPESGEHRVDGLPHGDEAAFRPEPVEAETEAGERDRVDGAFRPGDHGLEAQALPLKDLRTLRSGGVDEPDLPDAGAVVGAQLGASVVAGGGPGQDLDHQVGRPENAPPLEEGEPVPGDEKDVRLVDLVLGKLDRRPGAADLSEIQTLGVLAEQAQEEDVKAFVNVERRWEPSTLARHLFRGPGAQAQGKPRYSGLLLRSQEWSSRRWSVASM